MGLLFRLLVVTLLVVLQACGKGEVAGPASAGARRAVVEALELQPQDWQHAIEVYGVVEAVEEVVVSVEVSGTVAAVHFREGQRVARGALLLDLDPRKQALRLERAQSVVDSAAAALQEARSTLQRRRGLVAKSAVSRELLESGEIAARRAGAAYDDALAGLALAQRELDDSQVRSPVTGVVEQRQVEAGETVLPGQALATIQAVDVLHIVSFVSERDVNFLRVGAGARVRSPGARGRVFDADVVSIGVKADPRTGNFPVKLALQNGEGLLRPGMTARVTLDGLLERGRLLIPDSAVVDRDRHKVVYVLAGGEGGLVARERRPLLRATAGRLLPVIDGLVAGEWLIVSGLEWLVDGSPVTLAVDDSADDNAAAATVLP